MNKITDWRTGQLDASQVYNIQEYNKLYDYFSLILVYANVYFEEIRLQLLEEAEIQRSIIDPAIEDLEDLREFLHDIGVKDDSIIDHIEDMYERGGKIIDAVIDRVEQSKPPSVEPCADICDCDVSCDFNTCQDYSDSSSDEDLCDCYEPLCIEGVTDEDRNAYVEDLIPGITEDPNTRNELIEAAQQAAKEQEEAARQQQELQDKANQAQDKADQLAQQAQQAQQNAQDAAQNAKDALDDLLSSPKEGNVYEDNKWGDFVHGLFPDKESFTDKSNKDYDENRQAALEAAADVLQNGGSLEDAKDAYDNAFGAGNIPEDEWTTGDKVGAGLLDFFFESGLTGSRFNEDQFAENLEADYGRIEDAFNQLQEAQAAQDAAQAAQAAADAAQNAANQAQQAADNAAPPCHTCDCYNPTTGCPDAYTGPECNTCDGCYDGGGGCAADCFGNSDTPCDFSCDCSDSSCDCDSCGDCDSCDSCDCSDSCDCVGCDSGGCDSCVCGDCDCVACDCDSSCYCDCYSCSDCDCYSCADCSDTCDDCSDNPCQED